MTQTASRAGSPGCQCLLYPYLPATEGGRRFPTSRPAGIRAVIRPPCLTPSSTIRARSPSTVDQSARSSPLPWEAATRWRFYATMVNNDARIQECSRGACHAMRAGTPPSSRSSPARAPTTTDNDSSPSPGLIVLGWISGRSNKLQWQGAKTATGSPGLPVDFCVKPVRASASRSPHRVHLSAMHELLFGINRPAPLTSV